MATTKTEINEILAKCRKIKEWTVEPDGGAGGGWRITFDDGTPYLIHATYSDGNAPKRVLSFLNSKGFSDKLKALEDKHSTDKAARLAAESKAADAKAAKMAKAAEQLTVKAAGPYAGPQAYPYEWYVADHPGPRIEFVTIDPPLARQLMRLNVDNVPAHKPTVEYYRTVMADERFRMTHQGMAIDTRKVLQDGQKRLQACIDSDTPISVAFAVGMPPENFKVIDEGRNRSIADLLGKDDVADRNTVGTTVRLIAAYREPFPRAFLRRRTSNEVLYDAFKGDPQRLGDAVAWARKRATKGKVVASALCAATYLLREANGKDNVYVRAFLNGLVTGAKGDSRIMLDIDDPRLILRENMDERRRVGNRLRAVDQLGYILLAWNLIVSPQPGRRIKWNDGQDDIPQIVVCRDRGRTASAPPDKLRGEFTGE
jgi:hypothetical protein